MGTLEFKNPVFNIGLNFTVRRYSRYKDLKPGDVLELRKIDGNAETRLQNVVVRSVLFIRFMDLENADLMWEHDPACRTKAGLLDEMRRCYAGFDDNEVVAVIGFHK